jgi:hypothetical protein
MKTVVLIVALAFACQAKKHKEGASSDLTGAPVSVAKGAAKGASDLAGGAARGAVSLATLNPVGAATSVAGGAGAAGKDVAMGGAKGAVKATRGVGRLVKKVL